MNLIKPRLRSGCKPFPTEPTGVVGGLCPTGGRPTADTITIITMMMSHIVIPWVGSSGIAPRSELESNLSNYRNNQILKVKMYLSCN